MFPLNSIFNRLHCFSPFLLPLSPFLFPPRSLVPSVIPSIIFSMWSCTHSAQRHIWMWPPQGLAIKWYLTTFFILSLSLLPSRLYFTPRKPCPSLRWCPGFSAAFFHNLLFLSLSLLCLSPSRFKPFWGCEVSFGNVCDLSLPLLLSFSFNCLTRSSPLPVVSH